MRRSSPHGPTVGLGFVEASWLNTRYVKLRVQIHGYHAALANRKPFDCWYLSREVFG